MEKIAVGIDLGTTYSAVAVYRNGKSEIIQNDQGNRTTPSVVAFTSTQRLVGEAAAFQAANNPENTIYGVKRLMGRNMDDPAIQQDIKSWPFCVMQENNMVKLDVKHKGERKRLVPEQISAAILEKMKETAESFLGTEVKDVVVTCPAYFNNSQRQATKDAAQIAGLNVLRMINEPTAAAIAYGLNVNHTGRKNILIFDFGGGTFDVTILTIKDKDYKVRATNGDTHLGGEDFDQRMVEHFVSEFKRKNNRDISSDKGLMRNLKTHCERAKKILSVATKAEFVLEGTDLVGSLSRARFEDMNEDLFEKAIKLVGETLRDAEMSKNEIDEVVLVGGSSRIPKIQEMLSEFFDGKALSQKINPDEAVALGAAVQAALLQENVEKQLKGLKMCDVCPLSLGSEVRDGSVSVIIKRNSPIPIKSSKNFVTCHDYQESASVRIFEGERLMSKDNNFLGEFTVSGIPPMLRGQAKIENVYEIDENGILKVTAVTAGSSKSITITNKSRLSKDDATRLAVEAAKFKEEDKMHEERLKAYNSFERYLYDIRRKITSLATESKQKKAKGIVGDFSKWLEDHPLASKEEFEKKEHDLREYWHQIQ
ncbi:heat shock 70 kDa protein II-like [Culicoides brevitarsis]|uniref:heat shock 70 kDa protein II-like n=1 Tax=Culicoides brevitarsis TaxID=469753 RepID=UPI00307C2790